MAAKEIVIKIYSSEEGSKEPSSTPEKNPSEPSVDAKPMAKKAATAAAAAYITKNAIQVVKTAMSASYGRYLDLSEDYKAQVGQENLKAHINEIASIGSSIASGAYLGMKFGPVGAILGAVAGAVVGVTKAVFSRQITMSNQAKAIHEEAYSLYFNTSRAGMINYSRGTEN